MAKNQQQRNYITQQIQLFGDDWIVAAKPEEIQKNGKRILKEMVQGKMNYEQVGKYFLDSKFMNNLIISLQNELEVNGLYLQAVSFYKQYYPQMPNIGYHENHLKCLCYVYDVVYNKLIQVRDTQDIGYLTDISGLLFNFRNHLQ